MATSSLAVRVEVLEKELATLGEEVARLKARTETKAQTSGDWLDQIAGSFADDPDCDQAMALGRKYRESLRPKPRRSKTKVQAKRRRA